MRVHVAPMEAMSGDLVARPVTRRNAQILTRFPVHEHSAAMWAAMWAAAVAAEFGVLVPVIFAHGAPHPGYDIAFRLLGGWWSTRALRVVDVSPVPEWCLEQLSALSARMGIARPRKPDVSPWLGVRSRVPRQCLRSCVRTRGARASGAA